MKIPKILHSVSRQYRHNNNNDTVRAFDFDETIKIVLELEKRNQYLEMWIEDFLKGIPRF